MSAKLSPREQSPAPLFTPTPQAARRMLEFFTAQINNPHTRRAYLNAARRFAAWCQDHRIGRLAEVQPGTRRRFHSGPAGPTGPGHRQAAPGGAARPV